MHKTLGACALFVASSALCSPSLHGAQLPASDEAVVVLEGATLIDGTGAPSLAEAVIVLRGDRIDRIGRVGDFTYPPSADVVGLRGRFVIPGLIDVHAHIQTPFHREVMAMLLAFGITTVRIPGGTDVGMEARDAIERGELLGPRIFTGGGLIDGEGGDGIPVRTEDEARQEVRRQHAAGVDAVKLYAGLTPSLSAAVISEAHALGLPAIGHLSRTTWTQAAESGIDSLVHAGTGGPVVELISDAARRELADARGVAADELDEELTSLGSLIRMLGEPATESGRRIREMIDLDGPRVERLIGALKASNTMVDPTLVTDESLAYADEHTRILSRLEPYRTPARVRDFLWGEAWETTNRYSNAARPTFLYLKPLFDLGKRLTLKFFEEGVLLGAGSDVGMPWMTPGASFHRELELLVETGIPVESVLEIATRNGSHFVYMSADVGTIEEGKLADLVVLRADPQINITNTRTIDRVFKSGVAHDPEAILRDLQ